MDIVNTLTTIFTHVMGWAPQVATDLGDFTVKMGLEFYQKQAGLNHQQMVERVRQLMTYGTAINRRFPY
jgi:hypothetical protein